MWSWFTSLKRINNRMTISLCSFPGNSDGKASAYMWETRVRSLGQEDPLEKEMATHSSILAWKIPWTEEPGRLQSMGSQRVGHDWATSLSLSFTFSLPQTRHPGTHKYGESWGSVFQIQTVYNVKKYFPLLWWSVSLLWGRSDLRWLRSSGSL